MRPEILSRDEAIDRLSERLAMLAGKEKSVCRLATEEKILCRGFTRYTDAQMRRRYGFLTDETASRAELEQRADQWQVARRAFEGARTSCDVQTKFAETCRGWNEFTNLDLARFCMEICNQQVIVIGQGGPLR